MRVGSELACRARITVLRCLQVAGDVVMLELRRQQKDREQRERNGRESPQSLQLP